MTKDLGMFLLDALKDFNYDGRKTRAQLGLVAGDEHKLYGLTRFGKSPTIYVAKDQPELEKTLTQLHEFAHVYYSMIGQHNISEEKVDKLAQHWYKHGMGLK